MSKPQVPGIDVLSPFRIALSNVRRNVVLER